MRRRVREIHWGVALRKLAVAGPSLYWSSCALKKSAPAASISSSSITWQMESHQYANASRGCTSSVDQQRRGGGGPRALTSSTSAVMKTDNKPVTGKWKDT